MTTPQLVIRAEEAEKYCRGFYKAEWVLLLWRSTVKSPGGLYTLSGPWPCVTHIHGSYRNAVRDSVCRAGIEMHADTENGLVGRSGEGEGGTN